MLKCKQTLHFFFLLGQRRKTSYNQDLGEMVYSGVQAEKFPDEPGSSC